jgi:hypothetical protein
VRECLRLGRVTVAESLRLCRLGRTMLNGWRRRLARAGKGIYHYGADRWCYEGWRGHRERGPGWTWVTAEHCEMVFAIPRLFLSYLYRHVQGVFVLLLYMYFQSSAFTHLRCTTLHCTSCERPTLLTQFTHLLTDGTKKMDQLNN